MVSVRVHFAYKSLSQSVICLRVPDTVSNQRSNQKRRSRQLYPAPCRVDGRQGTNEMKCDELSMGLRRKA